MPCSMCASYDLDHQERCSSCDQPYCSVVLEQNRNIFKPDEAECDACFNPAQYKAGWPVIADSTHVFSMRRVMNP